MLYDFIKEEAFKQGMTIGGLERKADLGNGVIGRWKNHDPRPDSLRKVAIALDISPTNLLQMAIEQHAKE